MAARRIPLNFFAMPLGLAGLAGSWQTAADYGRAPHAVAWVLFLAATLAWILVLVGYVRYLSDDCTRMPRTWAGRCSTCSSC